MANKKVIKLFDKNHSFIDEVEDYSNLKYKWTLNGLGTAQFDVPLESLTCTETNYLFRNHVEVWNETGLVWGGQILSHGFGDGTKIRVGCYGYLSLLDRRRMRTKAYAEKAYGALCSEMVTDINTLGNTGVTIGSIAAGSLKTQRTVTNEDFLLPKLLDFCSDNNYDIEVDNTRAFNFYTRKGSDKSYYVLEYGTKAADNIIAAPELSRNALNLVNSIYSEVDNGGIMTSIKDDAASIALYGFQEGVLSASDNIINQSTLDIKTQALLQRTAYPMSSIKLTAINSNLCPFDDISIGDTVMVKLKPYWDYSAPHRILEMLHDEETGEREIILGDGIYRMPKPQVKIYAK